MAIARLPALDLRTAQALAQPLEQLHQALTPALLVRQQALALQPHRHRLDRAQHQRLHRRAQAQASQPLGQQTQHMGHVLSRLAQAQQQNRRCGAAPARVDLPLQLQRQHTLAARQQPGLQTLQQAARGKQQRLGMLDAAGPLQPVFKDLGQLQPGVVFRPIAIGHVQRIEQPLAKAAGHAVPWQRPQVLPLPATQALKHRQMRPGRAQAGQGQLPDRHPGRLAPGQAQLQTR